jgi:ferredoxin
MKSLFNKNIFLLDKKKLYSINQKYSKLLRVINKIMLSNFCDKKDTKENTSFNKSEQIEEETVNIIYKYLADGSTVNVKAKLGENILKTAHHFEIDLEGACDCSLACSTCHVILEQKLFDSIPKSEELEDDLLDLAYGLTHTSRLGCQIKITKEYEGAVISIPSYTKNLYVDGHKPKPH